MQTFSGAIQRYHHDFVKIIPGALLVLSILYYFHNIINFQFILQISFFERILIIFIFSYIIGKIACQIGGLLTGFILFILFQKDKKGFILETYVDVVKNRKNKGSAFLIVAILLINFLKDSFKNIWLPESTVHCQYHMTLKRSL